MSTSNLPEASKTNGSLPAGADQSIMALKCLTIILAATVPAFGIGQGGRLPWHLSRELKYFRQVTTGNIVFMGRKTWESIPVNFKPLKDRLNVVITSNTNHIIDPGVICATSLRNALEIVQNRPEKIYIIGGAQMYKAALELQNTQYMLLTMIHDPENKIQCDVFFNFNDSEWKRCSDEQLREFIGPSVELDSTIVHEKEAKYEFTLWKRHHAANY